MWALAAAAVDALHAVLMAVWILGLPLLFWRKHPALTRAYGVYAVLFVVATRLSHWIGGECILTTIAARFWRLNPGTTQDTNEWFTVRFARLVFGMTPSHRAIAWTSEALVFVTAAGVLLSLRGRATSGQGGHREAEHGAHS